MLAIDLTEDVADEVLSDGEVAVLIVYHPSVCTLFSERENAQD